MKIILLNSVLFFSGLTLLIYSSEWLIHGCVKLSRLFRVSSLFIGLVLVAFGTSAPEAAVGINAVLRGYKDIALANVLGSNIANLGLILGVCAILNPLPIEPRVFRRELPFMLVSVLLFYFLSLDGVLGPLDGSVFILAFIVFLRT